MLGTSGTLIIGKMVAESSCFLYFIRKYISDTFPEIIKAKLHFCSFYCMIHRRLAGGSGAICKTNFSQQPARAETKVRLILLRTTRGLPSRAVLMRVNTGNTQRAATRNHVNLLEKINVNATVRLSSVTIRDCSGTTFNIYTFMLSATHWNNICFQFKTESSRIPATKQLL